MKSLVIYRPCYAVTRPIWLVYPICHNEPTHIGKVIEFKNRDIQVVVESQTTLEAMELGMELINKFVEDRNIFKWRRDLGQL